MVKHQFIPTPGVSRNQPPTEQAGAVDSQGEQIRSTPAGQGTANLSRQQASATPYSPTEHPYLQAPQGLTGIPALPGTPKKVPLTNSLQSQSNPGQSRSLVGDLNRPQQASKPVSSGSASSIYPAGNVLGPTNRASNNGIYAPSSPYPKGNFSESLASPRSGTSLKPASNPPLTNAPGKLYPGNSQQQLLQHPKVDRRETEKLPPSVAPPGIGNFKGTIPTLNGSFPGVWGVPKRPQGIKTDPLTLAGPQSPKKKLKKPLPIRARVAIGILMFLVIVTSGAFVYYETQIAPALNNILGKQAIHRTDSGTQNDTGAAPTGRTNILLLGSDTDGKGNDPTNGTPLAQTVMIITVDPQTNYVGMLSIPRDMQVAEQGYIEPKLDEVFSHSYTGSNLQDKVASGAGEMEDIIQHNFGIHIDHYAWVGLGGFIKVIDTAGGIDVDTIHPMVDDTYPDDVGNTNGSIYDYKRLYIAPGPQHLNGTQALDYVRTRHSDLIGDFGRTIRQQQIISELKTKLATPDTLGNATQLLNDLDGAVQTDMQLSDIIGLGNLARGIDSNSVQHLTLGPPDYAEANTNGARTSNYLPLCQNIVPAIQKMFNINSPNCTSQTASTTSGLARTTPSTTTGTSTTFSTATVPEPNQGSTSRDTAQNNAALASGNISLIAGVHSLLGILFATTFESFDALQI